MACVFQCQSYGIPRRDSSEDERVKKRSEVSIMARFFSVMDNSIENRRTPWIRSIVKGLEWTPACPNCGVDAQWPIGDLHVRLEPRRGCVWPDTLGCGSGPLLIVSGRVLEAWANENVGVFPVHRVEIVPPLPKRLESIAPPSYFWIDGQRLQGAKMDFDASGFVDVLFCPACGRRTDNIAATSERQPPASSHLHSSRERGTARIYSLLIYHQRHSFVPTRLSSQRPGTNIPIFGSCRSKKGLTQQAKGCNTSMVGKNRGDEMTKLAEAYERGQKKGDATRTRLVSSNHVRVYTPAGNHKWREKKMSVEKSCSSSHEPNRLSKPGSFSQASTTESTSGIGKRTISAITTGNGDTRMAARSCAEFETRHRRLGEWWPGEFRR